MPQMTRQQLYELVWSKTMRDAAATVPMSDVGLKKACRRHGVPVPPQGYWNKVRAGHRLPRRPPLPAITEGQSEDVGLPGQAPLHGAALASKLRAMERVAQQAEQNREPTTIHGCVVRTRRALEKSQPDQRGALSLDVSAGAARIYVWPQSVERVLSVLNRLAHAAEVLGYAVAAEAQRPAVLIVDGEHVSFEISELFSRPYRDVSAEEKAEEDARWRELSPWYRGDIWPKKHVYVPSGKLQIRLGGVYQSGMRHT